MSELLQSVGELRALSCLNELLMSSIAPTKIDPADTLISLLHISSKPVLATSILGKSLADALQDSLHEGDPDQFVSGITQSNQITVHRCGGTHLIRRVLITPLRVYAFSLLQIVKAFANYASFI